MDSIKKRYETPDVEELEGNLFLVEAAASEKEEGVEGDDSEGVLDFD